MTDDYHGHMTFKDGSHVALSKEDAEMLWRASEDIERRRKELIPTEQAAIHLFFQAWQRLKDFGWREAMYCPKDGTAFDVIEAGSTGIHDCQYQGQWPDGRFWVADAGDLWPSDPVLFRLRKEPRHD